jgi:hypothetical protein
LNIYNNPNPNFNLNPNNNPNCKSEEGIATLLEEMRENLFDMIMEKQSEIDADVKVRG